MKIKYKNLVWIILLVLSISSFPSKGYACQCSSTHIPIIGAFQSDSIFYGTVRDIKEQSGNDTTSQTILFEVKNTLKGRSPTNLEINQANCEYRFETGKEYLVYAYNVENKLFTNLCDQKAADKDYLIFKNGFLIVVLSVIILLLLWRLKKGRRYA